MLQAGHPTQQWGADRHRGKGCVPMERAAQLAGCTLGATSHQPLQAGSCSLARHLRCAPAQTGCLGRPHYRPQAQQAPPQGCWQPLRWWRRDQPLALPPGAPQRRPWQPGCRPARGPSAAPGPAGCCPEAARQRQRVRHERAASADRPPLTPGPVQRSDVPGLQVTVGSGLRA